MVIFLENMIVKGRHKQTRAYPYREDAVGAVSESIEWLKKLQEIVDHNKNKIDELIKMQDPVESSRFIRSLIV